MKLLSWLFKRNTGLLKITLMRLIAHVNMDRCLFVAQVKRSIFGKSGFEIEYASDGSPSWLLSVDSQRIKPDVDENWKLVGYKYDDVL